MKEAKEAHIGVYAGSLRPGGGLTVLERVLSALAKNPDLRITIYTGDEDTSAALRGVVGNFGNIKERRFLPSAPASIRYLVSKVFFLREASKQGFALLLSFNYYIPAFCPLAVYHVNLLSFLRGVQDTLGMKVKRFDAACACCFASKNLFESKFLMEAGREARGGRVNAPGLLYPSIDPVFFNQGISGTENARQAGSANILAVSSIQAHKDNLTCLKAVRLICERRPDVDWVLTIAGGQNIIQWEEFKRTAQDMGIGNQVVFTGPMEKTALAAVMRRSLCLINSSHIESFCMVAVEAMASRCPAVVVNATAMPESVGEAAVIVEPGSAEGFADAILAFHEDSKMRNDYLRRGAQWALQFSPKGLEYNICKVLLEK